MRKLKDLWHFMKITPVIIFFLFLAFLLLVVLSIMALFGKDFPIEALENHEDYW